jgi:hypothetical protein
MKKLKDFVETKIYIFAKQSKLPAQKQPAAIRGAQTKKKGK